MARTHKTYDEDYKKNIVKLVENGKAISDIEREYDMLYETKKRFYQRNLTKRGNYTLQQPEKIF